MSIFIRGMEMPKNCGECFACKAELSQEKKVIYVCCFTRCVEADCPLVQVPTTHGRLIDADALIRELEITEEDDHNGATLLMAVFLEVLKSAPTVIDADEGE